MNDKTLVGNGYLTLSFSLLLFVGVIFTPHRNTGDLVLAGIAVIASFVLFLLAWNRLGITERPQHRFTEHVTAPKLPTFDEIKKSLSVAKEGYIYVIGAQGGLYKIGWSADVEKRMRAISAICPDELTLEHTIHSDEAPWAEKVLHTYFASKRVRGEWFKLSSADLHLLKSIRKM